MDKLFLTLLVVCCSTTFCLACTCLPKVSADEYCTYDIIFQGTALAKYNQRGKHFDPKHPLFADIYTDGVYTYTVHVDKIFWAKDDFKDLSTVSVSTPDHSCGTRLALDVMYVLYVRFGGRNFRTGACDQNKRWDHVSEPVKVFISNIIPRYCALQNMKNSK